MTNSPLARCVAGCWGGGHVKWCHEVAKPRRNGSGKIPATATIFENHNFYLKVFQNFEIKKQGNGDLVTQIVAVPEAAKSDTSYMILIFLFFHFFHFFYKFQKTKGAGDSWSDFVAVPEAAKSDTSHMILFILFFPSFSKILRISKNTR